MEISIIALNFDHYVKKSKARSRNQIMCFYLLINLVLDKIVIQQSLGPILLSPSIMNMASM